MNSGILGMYKPQGFTSFDVIGKLRGILHIRRLGHTGTLDPMAEGVLPVLVGSATKVCDILPCEDKRYRAGFRLGCITDTQDSSGTVLETHPVSVTEAALRAVLPQFLGEISQIPPMYSAVKVNGKRLYELARAGKAVERQPRSVTVHAITLLSYDAASGEGEIEIHCGKGTYVRTILHDIGLALGCGGCMTALLRTEACGIGLADCHTFAEVEQAMLDGTIDTLLTPADRFFDAWQAIHLQAAQTQQYRNGVQLELQRLGLPRESATYRVYDEQQRFLGLAKADPEAGRLRVWKTIEG